MEEKTKKLISKMTLEEKGSLCSGATFSTTKSLERLDIPSIHFGINQSVSATSFPSACGLASTWDVALVEKVGKALGKECQTEDVNILLGPGANIKRSPLCGKNFENYSEDPVLTGEMATAWINGVQSQGIGASLKNYVAHNQVHERMTINAEIDERTLREIYLFGFERAIKNAQPWIVMCAYNKVNGTFCSENKYLLTDILKEEWGFEGFVATDLDGTHNSVDGLMAGLDTDMSVLNGSNEQQIVEAVKAGELDESVLDKAVTNNLQILFKTIENNKKNVRCDKEVHHAIAREVAAESIVLLKNEEGILPLNKEKLNKVAIIGAFAKKPRYQGCGSFRNNPTKLDNAYDEIVKIAGDTLEISYTQGYFIENDAIDDTTLKLARETAKDADIALVFLGLTDKYESDGYDRTHMNLPPNQTKLIEEVCGVQENVVVLLSNGSPVTMTPWNEKVKGIIETWLLGQAGGGAIADILFGNVNPSGKLAETLPIKLSDNPSYLNFPGSKGRVKYQEGIFVGYRYYDKKEMDVLYPFGYGLSYTTFEYSNLQISKKEMLDTDNMEVRVKVKNTGKSFGKEIVQLYVRDIECREIRPEKELKAFTKMTLNPREEKEVIFILSQRDFAYYEDEINDWYVETGDFEIMIGKSSREICLRETVRVTGTHDILKGK